MIPTSPMIQKSTFGNELENAPSPITRARGVFYTSFDSICAANFAASSYLCGDQAERSCCGYSSDVIHWSSATCFFQD